MSKDLNILMLAAGLGTRLRPLTNIYPKPTVPFLNVPMGLYNFRFINSFNINQIVINTFHLPDKIKSLYRSQPYFKKDILFSDESGKILDSAGGLKKASHMMDLSKDILMMNADEILFVSDLLFLEKAYEQHKKNKALVTLVVTEHPEAGKKFGAIMCDNSKVVTIEKKPSNPELKSWHYVGYMFLKPEVLNLIPENTPLNIFYDVLIHQLKSNLVEIFPIKTEWYETGNFTDFLSATEHKLNTLDSETLKFINQFDPSKIIKTHSSTSLISESVNVDSSLLLGFNCIAKSTQLPILNKIESSILFDSEVLNLSYFS